jgi:hypothetical protein
MSGLCISQGTSCASGAVHEPTDATSVDTGADVAQVEASLDDVARVDAAAPTDTGSPEKALPESGPDASVAEVGPGPLDADDGGPDSCPSEADASPTLRDLGEDILAIGPMPTDQIYSGQFKLLPCEELINDSATTLYYGDLNSFPMNLTSGLTIVHTFEPGMPNAPADPMQPPGKYYVDSPMLTFDPKSGVYEYSFHATNFVTCPGTCQYIDTTHYRVLIEVR